MNIPFTSADILLPQVSNMNQWAVIACDQFTSQPEYWDRVRETAGTAPSALNLILPEAELSDVTPQRIARINEKMEQYMVEDVFKKYERAYVYVERTLVNGTIRRGLLGAVDLECYDYTPDAVSAIRATEKTVPERIPPRMEIRKDAAIELPHIILLCDDAKMQLIESLTDKKDCLPKLYEFDLMEEGGHIAGWLVQGDAEVALNERLVAYAQDMEVRSKALGAAGLLFAVGDGNHSLATAKACYEALKASHPGEDLSNHPARFALVELENIHDDAQVFEPIHRVVMKTDAAALLQALKQDLQDPSGHPVTWFMGNQTGTLYLRRDKEQLPVGILQNYLDTYMKSHTGEIDYIHGDDVVESLSRQEGTIGFLLPPMGKEQLFPSIMTSGVLPRKTFSMGHAREKRYYLEARKIR